jgi:prophage regulatory protein
MSMSLNAPINTTPNAAVDEDPILSWPRVRAMVGFSRTTAWREMRAGRFPRPIRISANRVGWRRSDLMAWLSRRQTEENT